MQPSYNRHVLRQVRYGILGLLRVPALDDRRERVLANACCAGRCHSRLGGCGCLWLCGCDAPPSDDELDDERDDDEEEEHDDEEEDDEEEDDDEDEKEELDDDDLEAH